jgi:hypothetical protein
MPDFSGSILVELPGRKGVVLASFCLRKFASASKQEELDFMALFPVSHQHDAETLSPHDARTARNRLDHPGSP